MILSLLMLLSLKKAHAGFFSRMCEKLVIDNPYQFEEAPLSWLDREYQRLAIKIRWHKANSHDFAQYRLIGDELGKRKRLLQGMSE